MASLENTMGRASLAETSTAVKRKRHDRTIVMIRLTCEEAALGTRVQPLRLDEAAAGVDFGRAGREQR
jgi:hypothetical protein